MSKKRWDSLVSTHVPRTISLNTTAYFLFVEYFYIQNLTLSLHTHTHTHTHTNKLSNGFSISCWLQLGNLLLAQSKPSCVMSMQLLGQTASSKSFKKRCANFNCTVYYNSPSKTKKKPKFKNLCIFTLHTYTITFSECLII